MHNYCVYILKCADDSYYAGVTNDLERRILEHQSGINPDSYTHSRRPVEMVFHREFKYIDQAIAFEKQIKGWSRKKKEAIIAGNWDLLRPLAKCLNKTSHENYAKAVVSRPAAEDSQLPLVSLSGAEDTRASQLPLVSLSGAEDSPDTPTP